jgi:hypothetical protein
MLWGILRTERDKEAGGWRKTYKELNNLYCLPSIIRMVKSKRMKWVVHVACRGAMLAK